MYINLDKAIHDRGISKNDIARLLNKTYGTVCLKINGVTTDFTLDEATAIHETYFIEYDFKYLFKKFNPIEDGGQDTA